MLIIPFIDKLCYNGEIGGSNMEDIIINLLKLRDKVSKKHKKQLSF